MPVIYEPTQAHAYQEEVIGEIDYFGGRVLLSLDMGLGKTYCSLIWMARRQDAFPALVVCPAVVKYNWEYEAARFIGVRAATCEGRKVRGAGRSDITIINYDILKDWLPTLKERGFRTIIFDECQNLSNPNSQRTKAGRKIAAEVPYVLALSGTPMLNRPYELFPILNILWPETYSSSWEFSQQFCGPVYRRWGWDHSGATNLGKLNKDLLKIGMIRRRKADVLKDLPDKVWRTVPCELSDPDEYHEANSDFLGWLEKNMSHKVAAASRAEKLTRIGYLLRLTARLKLRGVVRWANQFLSETDEKLIMFCVNQGAADVLRRRVEAQSVMICEGVTGRARQAAVDTFQKDPKTRLFIGTAAAGVGITLTAASEVGIAQLPWRPGDLAQWVDRSHRIGQTQTVFCNYLVALGTLEEKLCRLLHEKAKTISAVLDGGETAEDVNVYEELLATIEGELR